MADSNQKVILLPEADSEAVKGFATLNQELKLPVRIEAMSLEAAVDLLEANQVAAVVVGATLPTSEVVGMGIKRFNPRRNAQGEVDPQGTRQLVSSFFVFERNGDEPFLLADGAVNIDPDADALVRIAEQTCSNARKLGIEPRLAFLSYSSLGSAGGPSAEKVQSAVRQFQERNPEVLAIGEVQFDSATEESIYQHKTGQKYPDGKAPNVFIVPNLDTGNTVYKVLQSKKFGGGWTAIGPLLQGFEGERQLHDLSRGVTAEALASICRYVAKLAQIE